MEGSGVILSTVACPGQIGNNCFCRSSGCISWYSTGEPSLAQARSYAGTLTAMITRPSLHRPVRDIEGLLAQEEMSWVVEGGIGVVEYMQVPNEAPNCRDALKKVGPKVV